MARYFISLLLAGWLSASSGYAAEAGKIMLVLDASGSMWEQIDGKSKIEIARSTIAELVNHWPAEQQLGLMAYGHRRKGDCNDIETLIPPSKLDQAAFMRQVNALKPMGKTPLSQSVTLAAEALKYSEDPATVILVSDGEETCNFDPCAVAKSLEEKGVAFTAHVIGFDVAKPEQQAQLRCLAENTGGRFVSARNAQELQQALQQVVEVSVKAEPVAPKPAPPVKASYNLMARIALTPDGAPLNREVNWKLYAEQASNEELGEVLAYSYDPLWKLQYAPGRYLLEAQVDHAKVQQVIELTEQPQAQLLVLNAGTLKLSARASADTPPLQHDLSWKIFPAEHPDQQLAYSYDGQAQFLLPAGQYRVEVIQADAHADQTVAITAGQTTTQELIIGAGALRATVIFAQGAKPVENNVSWKVFKPSSDLQGEHMEQISYSYDGKPNFTLPAGRYVLEAQVGEAKVQQAVEVSAGKASEVQLNLNAGALKASAEQGGKPASDIEWEVLSSEEDLQGQRQGIAHSYDEQPRFILSAGEYLLRVKHSGQVVEQPVQVQANQVKEVKLVLP